MRFWRTGPGQLLAAVGVLAVLGAALGAWSAGSSDAARDGTTGSTTSYLVTVCVPDQPGSDPSDLVVLGWRQDGEVVAEAEVQVGSAVTVDVPAQAPPGEATTTTVEADGRTLGSVTGTAGSAFTLSGPGCPDT